MWPTISVASGTRIPDSSVHFLRPRPPPEVHVQQLVTSQNQCPARDMRRQERVSWRLARFRVYNILLAKFQTHKRREHRLSEISCLLTRVITNTKGSVCPQAIPYAGRSAQAQRANPGRENKQTRSNAAWDEDRRPLTAEAAAANTISFPIDDELYQAMRGALQWVDPARKRRVGHFFLARSARNCCVLEVR